jgi:hypothetical protein
MKNNTIKYAVINAFLTALYIIAIASFLFYAPKFFGSNMANNTVLMPIVMLSLLVFSAALVGSLIFGRPVLWYLDGKKNEAIPLLAYTLGIFLIITIAALLALYIVK